MVGRHPGVRHRQLTPARTQRKLSNDPIYALTAYILAQNKLIDEKQVINAQTLPKVQMPNMDNFIARFPERMPHN
jgi:S-disulfanyl-L-cysteine oxidoreductase SoxD